MKVSSAVDMNEIALSKSSVVPHSTNENFDLAYEFRHIFRVMGVFGLYHTPKRWRMKSDQRSWKIALYKLLKIYCLLIQISQWFNVIRIGVGIWIFEEGSMDTNAVVLKVAVGIWCLQCAANSSIWYCLCCTDKLPNIFEFWQKYCQSPQESSEFGTRLPTFRTRRFMGFVLAGSVLMLLFNACTPIATTTGLMESFINETHFMYDPFSSESDIWRATHLLITIYANAAFVFPVSFFLVFCLIISYQFEEYTKSFAAEINSEGNITKCLRSLRRQHQYLSKTVFLADDAFSFYLAVTVAANISLTCFSLYTLFISNVLSSIISKIFLAFWVTIVCINFGFVGLLAARVHEKVKSNKKNCLYVL